jgi:uncharacterized membrane protein YtjA (UPF0391 family)
VLRQAGRPVTVLSAVEGIAQNNCRLSYFRNTRRHEDTLRWIVIFLVLAIIAGVLGFGGIAGAATGIAKIPFWIFLVLVLLALIFGRRVF